MKICLLIINYNGLKYLEKYLKEISNSCIFNNVDLFITDDQSNDNSIKYLINQGYQFTINNKIKHGFAANVNNGIRYAKKIKNYDFYVIANNDVKIRKGLFEDALPKVLEKLKLNISTLGLIGFDEILADRENYFQQFDFKNYSTDKITEVKDIPGFFFIISYSLIGKIGLLDEDYFMYGEDNDYFARTLKAGFKIYNTALPIRHFSEGSSTNSKRTSWYVYRNALLYAQKNKGLGGVLKMIASFIWKIYNPFYRTTVPSNLRIIRNGFIYNNYLLAKSIMWNFNYYIKK